MRRPMAGRQLDIIGRGEDDDGVVVVVVVSVPAAERHAWTRHEQLGGEQFVVV